jgi:hypothetical protein
MFQLFHKYEKATSMKNIEKKIIGTLFTGSKKKLLW